MKMSNKKVEIDQKIRDQMKGGTHDALILGPGFDYKSPIEIFQADTHIHNVNEAMDNAVYRAVINADIKVDRDELIKALQYDRGQYEKGFTDGRLYKPPVETNGDEIRAMTDEEMAQFLHLHIYCEECPADRVCEYNHARIPEYCLDGFLSWLKAPVEGSG